MPLPFETPQQVGAVIAVAAGAQTLRLPCSDAVPGDHFSGCDAKESGLTNVASSMAAVPGQVTCLECNRWRPAPQDIFCAWCGCRLIRLKCDPAALDFRTDQKEGKGSQLNLHNDGINTLYASVEVGAPPEIKRRFHILPESKQGAVEIPGGAVESLTIVFDNAGIDPTQDYSAALEIYTNVDEPAVRVPLRVERPPIARLVFPPGPQQIIYGDSAMLRFSVRNSGGGVLDIETVKLQQYGHSSLAARGTVAAGQELPLELLLDLGKLDAGDYVARGRVMFRNHPETPFAIEFAFAKPARMELSQQKLQLGVYNIGRKQRQEIKFENIGAQTLKIISVRPSPENEWLSALCRIKEFDPGNEGYIDVFVDATALAPGSYSGELTIQTNGYDRNLRIPVDLTVHLKPALKEAVGIDFGTSVSCAAIVQNNKPVLIPLDRSNADDSIDGCGLPSVVFFEENFFPLVGRQAQLRATFAPAATVRSVKRILGRRRAIRIRDQERSPEEVTTEILRALLSAVENSTLVHGSPVKALFTVPADISDEQIKSVLASAKKAGLEIEDAESSEYVIDEPSAAAMYYLWKRSSQGECEDREIVFIYDFGAGTLDCSIVEITNRDGNLKIQVLATAGDPHLGGDDIDLALAQRIATQLGPSSDAQPHPVFAREEDLIALANDRAAYGHAIAVRQQARAAAEQLKIDLTNQDSASASFPASDGQKTNVTVTRGEFDALLTKFLERSDQVVLGCCNIARRKPEEIQTLLHTGRGSLIPKLRGRVGQLLPSAKDNSGLIEAKKCVALGAAWWAHIKNLSSTGSIEVAGMGRVLPNTICYLERVKGGVQVVNVPVFEAGERFPVERAVELSATQKNKKWRLDICEKRFGSDDEIRRRGSVELPAQPNAQTYKATFSINANRILEVSVAGTTLKIDPADDESIETGGKR